MLVLFAGAIVVLLLIAALAFDVGMMLVERRDQQNAADAAALAGARSVPTSAPYNGTCSAAPSSNRAVTQACQVALGNGFDDADGSENVFVYVPPIHGLYKGFPGFIEVQIESTRPSVFGGVIGRAAWPVGAYAVAANQNNLTFPFAMLALNPTACKAMQFSGGGVVRAQANIQSNSDGSDCPAGDPQAGISQTGGATVEVLAPDATCRTVGEIQAQGSGSMTCTFAPDSFALPDPLRGLPAPTMPGLPTPAMEFVGTGTPLAAPRNCPGGTPAPSTTSPQPCKLSPTGGYAGTKWLLHPGLYPGGIEVNNGTTAYLMPGIYWIGGGGFRTTTDGSVMTVGTAADAATGTWGGGVLIYNSSLPVSAGDSISLGGSSATLKLKPLDVADTDPDHIYNDIVIFQDRTLASPLTLKGAASSSEVEGIIYVPAAEITLNANGGTLVVDQVIADTYKVNGNSGTLHVMRSTGVDAVISGAGLVE